MTMNLKVIAMEYCSTQRNLSRRGMSNTWCQYNLSFCKMNQSIFTTKFFLFEQSELFLHKMYSASFCAYCQKDSGSLNLCNLYNLSKRYRILQFAQSVQFVKMIQGPFNLCNLYNLSKWYKGPSICAICTICPKDTGSFNLHNLYFLLKRLKFQLPSPFKKIQGSSICAICSFCQTVTRVLQLANLHILAKWCRVLQFAQSVHFV